MNPLDRLAHWWLMRRTTAQVTANPEYRESLPGWGTVAGEGIAGARWREAWIVVAFDEYGNVSPVTVFHVGAGWLPLMFESPDAADAWLASPAASIVTDGDEPVTVVRRYRAEHDDLIRGTRRAAQVAGALGMESKGVQSLPGEPGEEY